MTEQDAGDKGSSDEPPPSGPPPSDPTVSKPVAGGSFSMSRAFAEAFAHFGENSGFYIGVSLALAIPAQLATAMGAGGGFVGTFFFPLIVGALFGAISEGAITLGALRQCRGQPAGDDLVSAGLKFYGAILVAVLISASLFAVGIIFLVVPGIIVLSLMFFAIPPIIAEGASGVGGIERSMALGKGNRLEIFMMVLLFALVWMGGTVVLSLIFSVVPLFGGLVTWLYGGVTGAYGTVLAVTGYIQLREIEGNPLSVETAE